MSTAPDTVAWKARQMSDHLLLCVLRDPDHPFWGAAWDELANRKKEDLFYASQQNEPSSL